MKKEKWTNIIKKKKKKKQRRNVAGEDFHILWLEYFGIHCKVGKSCVIFINARKKIMTIVK